MGDRHGNLTVAERRGLIARIIGDDPWAVGREDPSLVDVFGAILSSDTSYLPYLEAGVVKLRYASAYVISTGGPRGFRDIGRRLKVRESVAKTALLKGLTRMARTEENRRKERAPSAESVIRAEERERCAKLIESLCIRTCCVKQYERAAAEIRGLT